MKWILLSLALIFNLYAKELESASSWSEAKVIMKSKLSDSQKSAKKSWKKTKKSTQNGQKNMKKVWVNTKYAAKETWKVTKEAFSSKK